MVILSHYSKWVQPVWGFPLCHHSSLASSSAVSLCWGGLSRSLSVVSEGLWQPPIPFAFIFQSALPAGPFTILASMNCVTLSGGTDQTVWRQHPCGRAMMDPHSVTVPQHVTICQPTEWYADSVDSFCPFFQVVCFLDERHVPEVKSFQNCRLPEKQSGTNWQHILGVSVWHQKDELELALIIHPQLRTTLKLSYK